VAQAVAPETRIVYVDNDPLVLVHARALLTSTPQGATDYIDADLHEPEKILEQAAKTLDFSQPVALTMLGVLHFVLDYDQARAIVRQLMDALPDGSYLVIAHGCDDFNKEELAEAIRFWNENAKPPIVYRSEPEIVRLFEGYELLEPGVVSCSRWRPEPRDLEGPEVNQFAGVARKL
jgi:O-methyltransferase involved in polyketide biosynthesis